MASERICMERGWCGCVGKHNRCHLYALVGRDNMQTINLRLWRTVPTGRKWRRCVSQVSSNEQWMEGELMASGCIMGKCARCGEHVWEDEWALDSSDKIVHCEEEGGCPADETLKDISTQHLIRELERRLK